MRVLSLFDGMSCGQIALRELSITPEVYYASEIDKHAVKQTQLNFPDTVQLGSVVDVDSANLGHIDLLIGGSPCQSFSFAGKRKGMATTESEEIYTLERYLELKKQGFEFEGQSYLFWEYTRILTELRKINPDILFLLENVEMGKKWERVLSQAIGVFGVHINSARVSAQNRKRIYWTNIRTRQNGLFGELYSDIPQPKDRMILLKDVLKEEVDEKYYLSNKVVNKLIEHKKRHSEQGHGFGAKFHSEHEKMQALKCGGKGIDDLVCVAMRGRNPDNPTSRKSGLPTKQMIELAPSGKTNCLTSVSKDNLILQRSRGNNQGGLFEYKAPTLSSCAWEQNNLIVSGTYRTHKVDGGFREIKSGKAAAIPARTKEDGSGQNCVMIDTRIRRLTPVECTSLQTIPDWYKWECSETQQYKMLGNGWTVEIIKHILSFLPHNLF